MLFALRVGGSTVDVDELGKPASQYLLFTPSSLTITTGDSIQFFVQPGEPHTVTITV